MNKYPSKYQIKSDLNLESSKTEKMPENMIIKKSSRENYRSDCHRIHFPTQMLTQVLALMSLGLLHQLEAALVLVLVRQSPLVVPKEPHHL